MVAAARVRAAEEAETEVAGTGAGAEAEAESRAAKVAKVAAAARVKVVVEAMAAAAAAEVACREEVTAVAQAERVEGEAGEVGRGSLLHSRALQRCWRQTHRAAAQRVSACGFP